MNDIFWFILPALAAAALAFGFTPLVARLAVRVGAMDIPDARKVHDRPIPRLGGLAVVASIALVFGGAQWLSAGRWELPLHLATGLGLGVLPILLVSICDDIRSVGARRKLMAHTLGAVIAVALGISLGPVVHLFGVPIEIGWMAWPLSVLWIVGVTNAFNLIDGLDGLSAGLALIAAASMAAVFAIVGQSNMAGVSLVLAGALLGFLPYNLHPARLFMGDTGATAIGFCLAAFALRGGSTLSSGFAALLPVLILGLPIADALIAVVRRTLHRMEHHTGGVFEADRDHIHHRLLALGVDYGMAVLLLHAAGLIFAGAALFSIFLNAREAALMVTALLVAGIVGIRRLGYDEFAFIRRGTVLNVYELPVVKRGFFVVLVDLVVAFAAAYVAVGLKTDDWLLSAVRGQVIEIATTLAPVTALVFSWQGMYRGSWRVAGLQDLTRVLVAVAVATAAGAFVVRDVLFERLSAVALRHLRCGQPAHDRVHPRLVRDSCQFRSALQPPWRAGADLRGGTAWRGRRTGALSESGPQPASGRVHRRRLADAAQDRGGVAGAGHRPGHGARAPGHGGLRRRHLQPQDHEGAPRAGGRGVPGTPWEPLPPASRHPPRGRRRGRWGDAGGGKTARATAASGRRTRLPRLADAAGHDWQPCPSCKGWRVHRSKARNLYERFRKSRTDRRLYRCEECGWRGWLIPLEFGARTRIDVPSRPDFRSLTLP